MIKQILAITSYGLCAIDRSYDETSIDPQLISAFIAAVVPHMDEMGFNMESITAQLVNDTNTQVEINSKEDWIISMIIDRSTSKQKIKQIMDDIYELMVIQIGKPKEFVDIKMDEVHKIEEQIDIIVAQKGIKTVSHSGDKDEPILPLLERVIENKMNPEKAAKYLLNATKTESLDKEGKQNILNSLEFLDHLISGKSNKLNSLLVLIRSTYQGVSKSIVRMDDALNF